MGCLKNIISQIINKEENFRKQELEYLRSELNQRLGFSYEHTNKLFGHIILLWGGTLLLFGKDQADFISIEKLFIMATVFFISVVVLYLLSQRNSDNMKEISKLAAYITVVYEKRPVARKQGSIFWEQATFEINKEEKEKESTLWKKLCNEPKNEYFWLSCIATVIIIVVCFIMYGSFEENHVSWMFVICLVYVVFSVLLSVIITQHLSLNWKKWSDKKKTYLRSFLEYAKKMNSYTDDTIKERFGEDFYKEIMEKQERESLGKGLFQKECKPPDRDYLK